jgi:hypothetical protein
MDDGLYPNLTLCCEINAHMNDIIVQQSIMLIWKALSHLCNSKKGLRSTTFNSQISIKNT